LCCFSGLRIRNHLRVSTLAAAAIGIETETETEIAITIQTSENEREAPRPANTNRRRNPDVKTSKENVKTSKENDETSKKMIEKYLNLNFERLELLSLHFSGLLTTKKCFSILEYVQSKTVEVICKKIVTSFGGS
jgi:hypothetical protein